MTPAESFKVGDRVKLGTRTGVIELFVSGAFVIKWDGRRDFEAYTRDAVIKQFARCGPMVEAGAAESRWSR